MGKTSQAERPGSLLDGGFFSAGSRLALFRYMLRDKVFIVMLLLSI